jgi:hemerythrin superfamily protein
MKKSSVDIIDLILEDHKPLKRLIKTLKSDEVEFSERQAAFEEFAPTLLSHAVPEEESWYMTMKKKKDLVVEGLEGDVEHQLADQMVEEIRRCQNEDEYKAKCKVVAELLEHHIKEEEEDMLPDYRKNSTPEEREQVGRLYLRLQQQFVEAGADNAPPEDLISSQSEDREHPHA